MCGILGVIPAVDHNVFQSALNTMIHRGPDDSGVLSFTDRITLGHRRLSIVDIQHGHQPMTDCQNRYSIVFNGEIYNFVELKKELENYGFKFTSNSDTEVILNSYIYWKEECVHKFNGMWSFVIWDNLESKLFLSRDRFGKKPLFYAEIDNKFIISSEMKAIYPFLKGVRPSKYFHWMKDNIFSYESTDKCLVDGIKRFPSGSNGVYKDGVLRIIKYWNTLDHISDVPDNYDEQVNYFRELFLDACKIRMRSDVPIGTALSGGLDSSATISAMAYLSKGKIDYGKNDWQHAFVASFPGTPLDETQYAKKVTDHIGIDAKYIDIDPLKYWGDIEDIFYQFEELYITSPIPMLMTYEEVKKYGVSVTLDGHGADELFSGYGHLLHALWDTKFNIKNTIDVLNTYLGTLEDICSDDQFKSRGKFLTYINYMARKAPSKMLGRDPVSKYSMHTNYHKLDYFSQNLYMIFHETVLPTLLRNYDRYSMMNSVEIRMPFMDHRIVTYVNSLPYSSKFSNGYTKKLIRDAMAPYMPKEITWRKSKIGFNTPIVNWMQGDLNEWFSDTVHEKSFLESELVDNPAQLKNNIMDIVTGKNSHYSHAQKCWSALSPYIWGKAVLDRSYTL